MNKPTSTNCEALQEAVAPKNQNALSELIDLASTELEQRKDYDKKSIRYIEGTWRQFREYCDENGFDHYLPEYKDSFLANLGTLTPALKPSTIIRKTGNMKILDLYSRKGTWEKGHLYSAPDLSEDLSEFVSSQEEYLKKRHYAVASIETINKQTTAVLSFFQGKGAQKLSEVTDANISDYVFSLKGHAKSTLRCELNRLKQILYNAYLLQYTTEDLSVYVPTFSLGQPQSKVKIWKSSEIDKVLDTVDRSNPKGLRDAAIITIASELGMRSKDITNLKLEDIDWEVCSITFTQSKTGKALTLPLNEKTGSAIIDYLRVRPATDSEYLFVNMNPPYDKMKSFSSSFHKYVSRSGVSVPVDAHHGLHSLRATLATRLLSADVDPDDIVSMIGHSDRESLHHYIRMDIEHLRECALSFDGGEFI